jgi:hypothetical protein
MHLFKVIFTVFFIASARSDEYLIEYVVFKNLQFTTDEVFTLKELSISPSSVISLKKDTNEIVIRNLDESFNSKNESLDSIGEIIYEEKEGETLTQEPVANPNPQLWFNENKSLTKLETFKRRIERRSDYELIDSGSWIQGVFDSNSSKFVNVISNELNLYIKTYKERYLHLDVLGMLDSQTIELSENANGIKEIKRKAYTALLNETDVKDVNISIDIDTLFEGDIKTIEQYPLDEIISKSSATLIIDEDRRVFNEQVHYFDHPQFGIMIYLKKLSGF